MPNRISRTANQVENVGVEGVWRSCRRKKYAFKVAHFLRNPLHLHPTKRTGIEEDGQAVSRKGPGRKYVYVMVFKLAHVNFLDLPEQGPPSNLVSLE
jgi:hypothetical protein